MIVITGMHRSGTSLTANFIHELDVTFGEASLLMDADHWNPRGYFENTEIHILNDQLLLGDLAPIREFRLTPPSKRSLLLRLSMIFFRSGYTLAGGHRQIARRAAARQADIRKLAEAYAAIAVKDPRFSITIGEWAKYATIGRVLYCYRHPFEVARSLQRKFHLPLWLGYQLWYKHVEEFLTQASGIPIVVVNYEGYFSDTPLEEIKRLYRFIGRDYEEGEAQGLLDRVLDPGLKRNVYHDQKIPAYIARTYQHLNAVHAAYFDLKPLDVKSLDLRQPEPNPSSPLINAQRQP